jgi:sugar lactone lactonase YvrE
MGKASILATNIGFPESPRWHEDRLWFSDIFGSHKVHTMDADGNVSDVATVPNCPSGLGWTPNGDLLVVSMDDCLLLRFRAGSSTPVVACDLSNLARVTNDMVVGPDGTAYIGDNGFRFGEEEPALGRILKVDPEGVAEIVVEGVCLPNGMVLSPEGRSLIVAETFGGRLSRFAVGPDGELDDRETFFQFDDLDWVGEMEKSMQRAVAPDGICLDANGDVWVGNPLRSEIACVSDTGQIVDTVQLSQPGIACVLGGPDGRTLFVTTGDLTNRDGAQGKIEAAVVNTPGP